MATFILGKTSRLVGRDEECATLEARLDDASRRDGSATVLVGAPGLGKTRLLQAWTEVAKARGVRTVSVANFTFARQPYGPIAEACRNLARSEPRAMPPKNADRALFDDFLRLFPPEHANGSTVSWEKRRLFIVVREFFERLGSFGPVLVTVDDAQWSDPETVEMIAYLATQLVGIRLAIAIAIRPLEHLVTQVDQRVFAAIDRLTAAYRVNLGLLDDSAVREMIFAIVPPDRRISRRVVDEIARRSEGSPLLVEELVRDALCGPESRTLPATVTQSVTDRFATLDPDAIAYLETAATIGTSIDRRLLRELCPLVEAEEYRLLRDARDLGLIVDGASESEPPRFRHEIVREALSSRSSALERAHLHERVAKLLESEGKDAPEMLAFHWQGAGRLDLAAPFAERAGDSAAEKFAFATARDFYETSLADALTEERAGIRVYEKLGHIHDLLGSSKDAYDCFSIAAQRCRAVSDRRGVARLSLRMANASYRLADSTETLKCCRDAIVASDPDDPERFAAEVLLATFHAYRAEVDDAKHWLANADAFVGIPDPAYESRRHVAAATIADLCGRFDESQRLATLAVEAAKGHGDPVIFANTCCVLGDLARTQANFVVAESAFAQAIETADAYALDYTSSYARLASAEMAFLRGDASKAHRLLRFACALAVEGQLERLYSAAVGIPIALAVGDASLVERLSDPVLLQAIVRKASAHNAAALASVHVELRFARGDAPGISELIDTTLPKLDNATYVYDALLRFARFGDRKHAERALVLFDRSDLEIDPIVRLHARLVGAIVARHRGDATATSRLLLDARGLASALGLVALEALAYELGGDIAAAVELYRTMGATYDVGRLTQMNRRPEGSVEKLSRRELQVAHLVASGRSNRAIAEQLSLSNRTVEHHVTAIFGKLDIRSRVELARRLSVDGPNDDERPRHQKVDRG